MGDYNFYHYVQIAIVDTERLFVNFQTIKFLGGSAIENCTLWNIMTHLSCCRSASWRRWMLHDTPTRSNTTKLQIDRRGQRSSSLTKRSKHKKRQWPGILHFSELCYQLIGAVKHQCEVDLPSSLIIHAGYQTKTERTNIIKRHCPTNLITLPRIAKSEWPERMESSISIVIFGVRTRT